MTAALVASPPTPVDLDITVQADVDLDVRLSWTDAAGAVLDLTGYTAQLRFRPAASTETGLATVSTATDAAAVGRITVAATAPNMRIAVPAVVTSALAFRRQHHVLEVTDPAGITRRWAEGDVRLDRSTGF